MKEEYEFEKKIILTNREYLYILMTMCKHAPVITQTNYYFDTDDFSMNRQGITCRIRKKKGKFTTTIKKHSITIENCSVEKTSTESDKYDTSIFDAMKLKIRGAMLTERTTLIKDEYVEVVLDKNTYLSYCDYEIEVEYNENSEDKAMGVIENIAKVLLKCGLINSIESFIVRIGKNASKSERFFQMLSLGH